MLPELIRIGNFFLPTYGVLVALGFLAALKIVGMLARRSNLNHDSVLNLGIYCAIAGIAGAKVMMFLIDIPYYAQHPNQIFTLETLQAAGVFYGGLIGALVVAVYYMRREKLPLGRTADCFEPGIALGHAIGRLGCFSAGCCYGLECHLPWAVTFTNPAAHERSGTPLGTPLHPTQLYESLGEFLIFALLYRRFQKPHAPGTIIGLYLMLYSALRFLVEFLRVHDQANPFGGALNTSQWLSMAIFAMGAIWRFKAAGIR